MRLTLRSAAVPPAPRRAERPFPEGRMAGRADGPAAPGPHPHPLPLPERGEPGR